MKLTCDRAKLIKPLGHIQSIVERRNTLFILGNVVLKAADGELKLIATDMDIDIVETVPASILEAGEVTIPAQIFYDIVRKLPDGAEVEISLDANEQAVIKVDKLEFKLATLPVKDFPIVSDFEAMVEFTLASSDLKNLIESTRFAIGTEETRTYLNGIYMHVVDGNILRMVATDGHRLALAQVEVQANLEKVPSVILPRKIVNEMSKWLDEYEGDVRIRLNETQARLIFDAVEVTTKLIDGTFPDYNSVIPKNNNIVLSVSVAELKSSVGLVSTVAQEKSRSVRMQISDQNLVLSATDSVAGTAKEEIEVEYNGAPMTIGFNAKYLMDVAQQIDGEVMEIAFSDTSAPVIIQTPESNSSFFVLMPARP